MKNRSSIKWYFVIAASAASFFVLALFLSKDHDWSDILLSILSITVTAFLGYATYIQTNIQNELDMLDKTPVILVDFSSDDFSYKLRKKLIFSKGVEPVFLEGETIGSGCRLKITLQNITDMIISKMSVEYKIGQGDYRKEIENIKYEVNHNFSLSTVSVIDSIPVVGGVSEALINSFNLLTDRKVIGDNSHVGVKPNGCIDVLVDIPNDDFGGDYKNIEDVDFELKISIDSVYGYSYLENIKMKLTYITGDDEKSYFNAYDYHMNIKSV